MELSFRWILFCLLKRASSFFFSLFCFFKKERFLSKQFGDVFTSLISFTTRSHQRAVWERQSYVKPRFCLAFRFSKSFTDCWAGVTTGMLEFPREFLDKVKYGNLLLFKENQMMALYCLKRFQMTPGVCVCAYSAARSRIHLEEAFGNTIKDKLSSVFIDFYLCSHLEKKIRLSYRRTLAGPLFVECSSLHPFI